MSDDNPAQEVAEDFINGQIDYVDVNALRNLGASDADMKQAIVDGARHIVGCCNRVLHMTRDSGGNDISTAGKSKWQQIGQDAMNGVVRNESTVNVFIACMQAVSKVGDWERTGLVRAI
ncbi:uncharacterized protein LTR77_009257 [Saxophila tyrrhenica]|uniref:Uncharacterized protein n=1 Tax=Saxophila tyrrhenica TaxID=1690608 RepID=A0AAV9NYQ6_9PEZI|nr:hypothetical protein LTR77_009257 [Saxophila tyrrhenica]